MRWQPTRRLATWALAVYAIAMLFIVFQPLPILATGWVTVGHDLLMRVGAPPWTTAGVVEWIWNVAMFVPLTLLGTFVAPRVNVPQWVSAGFLTCLLIEVVQLLVLPDRSASLVDISANTLGAFVGALLGRALSSGVREGRG